MSEDTKKFLLGVLKGLFNLVHIMVIASLLLFTLYAVVADGGVTAQNFWGDVLNCLRLATINQIFTFIGAVAFILFGIVGMYEFLYTYGLHMLLPPFYLKYKEQHDEKTARTMMKTYYQQDIKFIQQYERERSNRILQAMGITEKQFHHIQYELLRARVMPDRTLEDIQEKLRGLIYQKEFIVDQSNIPQEERVYKQVDYFLNLYTALYDPQLCDDVGEIMAKYIQLCLEDEPLERRNIDYIIVPHGSNLLLGLAVGKHLQKPVIAVQSEERIEKNKFWDGHYKPVYGRKNNVVIVHDVLVSGRKIYNSLEKLKLGMEPDTYGVLGLYCLVRYKHEDHKPEEALGKAGIEKCHCIVDTDETILTNVIKGEE